VREFVLFAGFGCLAEVEGMRVCVCERERKREREREKERDRETEREGVLWVRFVLVLDVWQRFEA